MFKTWRCCVRVARKVGQESAVAPGHEGPREEGERGRDKNREWGGVQNIRTKQRKQVGWEHMLVPDTAPDTLLVLARKIKRVYANTLAEYILVIP